MTFLYDGMVLECKAYDHLIMGTEGYYSFKDEGII